MEIKCSKQILLVIIGVHVLVVVVLVALLTFLLLQRSKSEESKVSVSAPRVTVIKQHLNKPSEFDNFLYLPNGKGHFESIDLVDSFMNIETEVLSSDVSYDLYTKKNQYDPHPIINNNINELTRSNFDPKKMIIFVAHGWTGTRTGKIVRELKPAILENHDVNLFIVDWSRPAKLTYLLARNAVRPVGVIVGNFINEIQSKYKLTGSSFVLIGNSLGAHVVGNAGWIVKSKVGHIVGLDPALPLFNIFSKNSRLDESDGLYVQVIHTCAGRLGFFNAVGHVDYYPNGGFNQPGCGLLDLLSYCSHRRAYSYYAESVRRGPFFLARQCMSNVLYQAGMCSENPVSFMGQLQHNNTVRGTYYLETNSKSPFAKS